MRNRVIEMKLLLNRGLSKTISISINLSWQFIHIHSGKMIEIEKKAWSIKSLWKVAFYCKPLKVVGFNPLFSHDGTVLEKGPKQDDYVKIKEVSHGFMARGKLVFNRAICQKCEHWVCFNLWIISTMKDYVRWCTDLMTVNFIPCKVNEK